MGGKQINLWVQNLDGEDIPIQEFREELYEVMQKYGVTKLQAFAQFDERFGTADDGDVVVNCYTHLEECQPVPVALLRETVAATEPPVRVPAQEAALLFAVERAARKLQNRQPHGQHCVQECADLSSALYDITNYRRSVVAQREIAPAARNKSVPVSSDLSNPGLYNKYTVARIDGRSGPGQRHEHCEYFVLDLHHDPFAIPALKAYADAARLSTPRLAADVSASAKRALDRWFE